MNTGMKILSRSKLLRVGESNIVQKFKNLLIVDFEATCEKNVAIAVPEIIEFPCVAVNTNNWKIDNVFHEYVKPRINPILSTHCIDLTGIMQETVENEQHFPIVLEKFHQWLENNGYLENFSDNSAFVTSGDWDLRVMLPDQCARDDLAIPNYFKQWINLKATFVQATNYYPRSIKNMLNQLNLPVTGQLHSGLDDSLNMAKIIQALMNTKPVKFDITSYNVGMVK